MKLRKKLLITLLSLWASYSVTNAEQYCSEYDQHCSEPRYEGPIDCDACCAQGDFVSDECLRRCNGCYMRNDQATKEGNDWPSGRR